MKRLSPVIGIVGALLVAIVLGGCPATDIATTSGGTDVSVASGDAALARAFAEHAENLELEGRGTVTKLLADDTEGDRHQRFIVRLAAGQTLLVTHNIDVAPRVASVQVGDTISFKGEYVWNAQGGLIHWTHHDPEGSHPGGWIKHNGRTYQ